MHQTLIKQVFTHKLDSFFKFALLTALGLAIVLTAYTPPLGPLAEPTENNPQATILDAFNELPLSFISNAGQTDSRVEFMAHSWGGRLFFTSEELVLSLPNPDPAVETGVTPPPPTVLRVQFDGANPSPQISGGEKLSGIVNYFIGNDPDEWQTNIATYAGLTYIDLYPGIDLHYEGQQGLLKSTYTIAPGVDPAQIGWRYRGAGKVRIEAETGDLFITVPLGNEGATHTLREQAPLAWQDIGHRRIAVEVSYIITGNGRVSFALGVYDPTYPLVIDPITLVYSTYLEGSSWELGVAITVDSNSHVYVTGVTASNDFPTKNAYDGSFNSRSDVFVTKLDTDQSGDSSLVYSTYLGGSGQSANEEGFGVAVDSHGNVYVTGFTQSDDFPTYNAYDNSRDDDPLNPNDTSNDVFVTKLDSSGSSLLYSTYLGGDVRGDDIGYGIAVDNAGNAYVSGFTGSDFPTKNAYQSSHNGSTMFGGDAFVTRLDTTQSGNDSLIYSTYLGGSNGDYSTGIVADSAGNAYLSGCTDSIDFPTQNAYQNSYGGGRGDAFVTKLDTTQSGSSSLIYSTYLGGSGYEGSYHDANWEVRGVIAERAGNVYVTGFTDSTDFPTQKAYQNSYGGGDSDAFVAKLSTTGSALVYSTYLGGTDTDFGDGIAVDSAGNVYVVGSTNSTNFPTQNAYDNSFSADYFDAFITKLSAAGDVLVYSTYLGGNGDDFSTGIAVDSTSNVYLTGVTNSPNFPTQNAYDNSLSSDGAIFVTRLAFLVYLPLIIK